MVKMNTIKSQIYWGKQHGRLMVVALTEHDAWEAIRESEFYEDDPTGWAVECTFEDVPIVVGDIVHGQGEAITLDESTYTENSRVSYCAMKIFWDCPLCGESHGADLFDDPIGKTGEVPNPTLSSCDKTHRFVFVLR